MADPPPDPDPGFDLFTTLRYDKTHTPDHPYYLIEFHRERMLRAAYAFDWKVAICVLRRQDAVPTMQRSLDEALRSLEERSGAVITSPLRLRLVLNVAGQISATCVETPPVSHETMDPSFLRPMHERPEWSVYLSPHPVVPGPHTQHKTTLRGHYEALWPWPAGSDRPRVKPPRVEILCQNPSGAVMEGTITSVYFSRPIRGGLEECPDIVYQRRSGGFAGDVVEVESDSSDGSVTDAGEDTKGGGGGDNEAGRHSDGGGGGSSEAEQRGDGSGPGSGSATPEGSGASPLSPPESVTTLGDMGDPAQAAAAAITSPYFRRVDRSGYVHSQPPPPRRERRWVTPHWRSGGNLSTTRRIALMRGLADEAYVPARSLRVGETVWLSNSVRGWFRATVRPWDELVERLRRGEEPEA